MPMRRDSGSGKVELQTGHESGSPVFQGEIDMRRSIFAWLAFAIFAAIRTYGQINATGTLLGTVTDQSGAVVPAASVQATSKETGLARQTTTNEAGQYRFDLLPAGIYEVRVTMKGFATSVHANVGLAVSENTTVDVVLQPSSQAEVVTVEASGAPLIDTQKTDVSLPVTASQIQELPLNGRDFVNLAYLAPGARPQNSYDPTKNRIGVFSVDGSNGRNVNVTVNGIDDKDNTVGGPVMQLPLEAVQEFNISTQRFSAANGRSEGAAITAITRSGTNQVQGSLYLLDRNQALNTLNYFEQTAHGGTGQKAPFSRQQFGGSIGGPLKKDKTFLFFAIERSREQTSINTNPAAYADAQALTKVSLPYGIQVDPVQTIATPYYDWRYNGRLDHDLNDKNRLSLSYSNQNNRGLNDQASGNSDGFQTNFTTNQLIISNATLNSVISPTMVNSFTAGYQYWNNLIDANQFVPNLSFPNLSAGTNPNVPQESYQAKWQFKDDYSINHGAHSFKFGVDYLYEPKLGGFFVTDPTPAISFFDDPTKILSDPADYPQGLATPGAVQSITVPNTGNPYFAENAKSIGLYVQDDWKATRRLTLNIGLRWDKDYDLNGGAQQATSKTYLELKAIGSPYAYRLPQNENRDFSPRFGLAYDLTGSGKHVLRAGYGLYYGQTFQNIPLFMEQQANATVFTTINYTSPG